MRAANIIVSVLGVAALAGAAIFAWRWRALPLLARPAAARETRGRAFLEGLRTLAVVTTAGVVAGVLVPGFGGRLVMRVLGATSGDAAQGQVTEADEIVGGITSGGTIAILVFVGLAGGLVTAFVYLVARRWLPSTAAPAGALVGLFLLGTIGVDDAMSPDNVDFAILEPTWLAVVLISGLALLFGVTYTALAARLDVGIPSLRFRLSSLGGHASLVFTLIPPLVFGVVAYLIGRVAFAGRLATVLTRPTVRLVGQILIGAVVALASFNALRAIIDIISS